MSTPTVLDALERALEALAVGYLAIDGIRSQADIDRRDLAFVRDHLQGAIPELAQVAIAARAAHQPPARTGTDLH